MSFPAALNLLKRDVDKKPKDLPTFPLLRDMLSVTPARDREALYTFIDKETLASRAGSRTIHRLYVYVPNCDSKCVGWVMNDDIEHCMVCNRQFGLFLWKKHCRCCGNVICGNCVVDQELIIVELSDLGEQMLCVQCYYGQEEVHAQVYIVGKAGLDKTYYPPPPVRRLLTGELSRHGTGELSRRGTGTGIGERVGSPGPMASVVPHSPRHRGAPAPGKPRPGQAQAVAKEAEDARRILPTPGFIIKTRVLDLANSADQNYLNVYINVLHQNSIPRSAQFPNSDAPAAQEYHPLVLAAYKEYARTSNGKTQKFVIFNVAVSPLHVMPLVSRMKFSSKAEDATQKKAEERGPEMLSRYERLCLYILKHLENSFENLLLSREISFPLINVQNNFIGPKGETAGFPPELLATATPRVLRPLCSDDPQLQAQSAVWFNSNPCMSPSSSSTQLAALAAAAATPETVLVLNETTDEGDMQLGGCKEIIVQLLPGVVMKSFCNRKVKNKDQDQEQEQEQDPSNAGEGVGGNINAMRTPSPAAELELFSPFSSPLASPIRPGEDSSQPLYQHRVFVNICHNRHLPLTIRSNSAQYYTEKDGGISLDSVLSLMSSDDLYLLCNAPKLGTPVASTKETKAKDRTLSRDFLIYDVILCSSVYRTVSILLKDYNPSTGIVEGEWPTDEELAAKEEFLQKQTVVNTYLISAISRAYGDAFSPACSFPKTKNGYKGNVKDILPFVMKTKEIGALITVVAANAAPVSVPSRHASPSPVIAVHDAMEQAQNHEDQNQAEAQAQGQDNSEAAADGSVQQGDDLTSVAIGSRRGSSRTSVTMGVTVDLDRLSLSVSNDPDVNLLPSPVPAGMIKITKEKSAELKAQLLGSPPDRVLLRQQSMTRQKSGDVGGASSLGSNGSALGSGNSSLLHDAGVQDWLDLSDEYGYGGGHTPGNRGSARMRGLSDGTSPMSSINSPRPTMHQHLSNMSKDQVISSLKAMRSPDNSYPTSPSEGAAPASATATGGEIIYGHTTPWEMFLKYDERMLACGLIGKRNKVGIIKQRQLILTDYPRLFYVDPKSMTVRGEIDWPEDDPPYCIAVSFHCCMLKQRL